MVSLIVEGKRIYDKFTKDEVTVYAAQASFFIVLSFFPFIMLLLTLIQFIPQHQQIGFDDHHGGYNAGYAGFLCGRNYR